jgi:hypothetical protein
MWRRWRHGSNTARWVVAGNDDNRPGDSGGTVHPDHAEGIGPVERHPPKQWRGRRLGQQRRTK